MAVFAEPSAAVETALDIQTGLVVFNKNSTEIDDINVRIGLHMGQVSVENNLQVDVFGRHVNRAARIESLGQGGQVLLSYTVFDSAKGWLASHDYIEWTEHGVYQLKGIDEKTAIYEVNDKRLGKAAKAPIGKIDTPSPRAMKSKSLWLLLSLLAGVATAFFAWQKMSSSEVTFREFYGESPIINSDTPLVMEGQPGDPLRKSLTELKPGKHVIHYDVNYITRYYSEIDVKPGENFIKAKFFLSRLPDLNLRYELPKGQAKGSESKTKTFNYVEFDSAGNKIEHEAKLIINVNSHRDEEKRIVNHEVDWKIYLDGKELRADSLQASHPMGQSEIQRFKLDEPVYSDDFHKFTYRYYTSMSTLDFTLHGNLTEYSYSQ